MRGQASRPVCSTPFYAQSTEPPDERRGLLMSKRSMPGLGRRGSAAGVLRMESAESSAALAIDGSALSVDWLCMVGLVALANSLSAAHTSAVQRQRERTISLSWSREATITRPVDSRSSSENKM
ncbi:uncharacterized protein LOC115563275 [Drosophila navojoa]|uniref:uncharacterized protein LOC115563275 n=1 Tax=Drosophila navojoa TaxID=7232 RepID=UPI0011BD5B6A|nr:uncharacterized protein LOC115563275 [Drosophila navojoa]